MEECRVNALWPKADPEMSRPLMALYHVPRFLPIQTATSALTTYTKPIRVPHNAPDHMTSHIQFVIMNFLIEFAESVGDAS